MMTLGRLAVKLGLLRIPGIYPLNEAPLTDEEVIQQKLLMYRNAVNPVYIAEGQKVLENAKVVKAGGNVTCPLLMFCSDGTEIGDFWIPVQKEFAEENQAELVFFDCGHYIHYFKSESLKQSSNRGSPKKGARKQPQELRRKNSMDQEVSSARQRDRL